MGGVEVAADAHDVPAALQACDGGVQVVLEEGPDAGVLDNAPPPGRASELLGEINGEGAVVFVEDSPKRGVLPSPAFRE